MLTRALQYCYSILSSIIITLSSHGAARDSVICHQLPRRVRDELRRLSELSPKRWSLVDSSRARRAVGCCNKSASSRGAAGFAIIYLDLLVRDQCACFRGTRNPSWIMGLGH